ncbi:MAG: SDR family NAD(P)-dependent oxidoreductase [Solirubrobacteraceae bacterium]
MKTGSPRQMPGGAAHLTAPVDLAVRNRDAAGTVRVDSAVRLRVLVLGAGSDISVAIVQRLARDGQVEALLLGPDYKRMAAVVDELKSTGRATGEFDGLNADEVETHADVITCAFDRLERVDLVILSVGVLGALSGLDADPSEVTQVLRTNFLGCGSLLWHTVRALRKQGHGTVVVLSSVAAERPRGSNAIYGAAKAGLDALAQGLADAVAGTSVRVLVIRPGFVATRMTAGLKPGLLSTSPQGVADATVAALDGRRRTVWIPAALRYVFAVLRHLPGPVYRRLPL